MYCRSRTIPPCHPACSLHSKVLDRKGRAPSIFDMRIGKWFDLIGNGILNPAQLI